MESNPNQIMHQMQFVNRLLANYYHDGSEGQIVQMYVIVTNCFRSAFMTEIISTEG